MPLTCLNCCRPLEPLKTLSAASAAPSRNFTLEVSTTMLATMLGLKEYHISSYIFKMYKGMLRRVVVVLSLCSSREILTLYGMFWQDVRFRPLFMFSQVIRCFRGRAAVLRSWLLGLGFCDLRLSTPFSPPCFQCHRRTTSPSTTSSVPMLLDPGILCSRPTGLSLGLMQGLLTSSGRFLRMTSISAPRP